MKYDDATSALSHLELFASIAPPLLADHRSRERSSDHETRFRLAGTRSRAAASKTDQLPEVAEMSNRSKQLYALALDPNEDAAECAQADLLHETAPIALPWKLPRGRVVGGKLITSI